MKSGLFVTNNNSTAISAGSIIPFTSIERRFGNAVDLCNNTIVLNSCGYYKVDVIISVSSAAAQNVEITLKQNGVDIETVTATTGADSYLTIPISAIVRCKGCNNTITVSSANAVTNSFTSASIIKM